MLIPNGSATAGKVLPLLWTENVDNRMQTEVLELFSGQAQVSQAFREAGYRCVSFDTLYDPTGVGMDFLSSGGFALGAQSLGDARHMQPWVCKQWGPALEAVAGLCSSGSAECHECSSTGMRQLVHGISWYNLQVSCKP